MNFDVKETSTTISNNNKDKNTKPSNVNVSKDATKTYTVNNSNTFVNKETGTIETNANVNTVLNAENNSEKTGAVSSGFFGLFKKVWDIIKRSFTKKEIPKESNVNTKAYKFDESDSYSQLIAETVDADGDGTLEIVDNSKEENELQGEIDRLQWEIDNVYNPKIKELEQSQNGEYNYDTNGDEHVGLSEIFGGLVTQLFTDEEKDIEANEKLKNENLAKINKLKEKLSKLQEEDQINLMNRNVFYRALQLRSDYTENTTESKIADAKKVLGDRALYMTDQEIADFTYLYNVYGEASSNQFIDFYKDAMNQREGFNMAVETLRKNFTIDENGNIVSMSGDILNDTAICSILGFDAGVENFVAGLGNLLKGIHGNLSGEITPEEYKKLLIAQAICEYGGLTEWAYKISQSLGGMVIPIGAGAVAEAYGMDGQGVATLLIFLSSTGNSWKEGLQKGYDPLVAEFYGIVMGSIEAGTERLIGGIPGLDMLTKQTYGVGVKGLMEMLLKSGLSEASEEVVTYVLEGIVDSLFSGEPFKLDLDHLKEMGETAAIAFVTSLIMNGGTLVLKTANGSYNINAPDASNITSKEDIDAFYEAFQYKADLREGKNVKFEDLSLKAQQYILNGDISILSGEAKAQVNDIIEELIKEDHQNAVTEDYISTDALMKAKENHQNAVTEDYSLTDALTKVKEANNKNKIKINDNTNASIDPTYNPTYVDMRWDFIKIFGRLTTEEFGGKKYFSFDTDYQIFNYYGDYFATDTEEGMFKDCLTTEEILDKLDDSKKVNFQEFLQKTQEGSFLANLIKEEIRTIQGYTTYRYQYINGLSRGKNPKDFDIDLNLNNLKKEIELLDGVIEKYGGFRDPIKLYRGCSLSAFTSQNSIYSQLFEGINIEDKEAVYGALKTLEGKELRDLGFMSTSLTLRTSFAERCPIVLEIYADEGTKGAKISTISDMNEHEVILARGTKLQIVEVSEPIEMFGNKKIVVKCKTI